MVSRKSWMPRLRFLLIVAVAMAAISACTKGPVTLEVDVTVNGDEVTVAVSGQNLKLQQKHHVHLYLDGGPEIMMYSPTYVYRKVPAGKHTLVAQLSNAKHEPIPGIQQTIEFEVP